VIDCALAACRSLSPRPSAATASERWPAFVSARRRTLTAKAETRALGRGRSSPARGEANPPPLKVTVSWRALSNLSTRCSHLEQSLCGERNFTGRQLRFRTRELTPIRAKRAHAHRARLAKRLRVANPSRDATLAFRESDLKRIGAKLLANALLNSVRTRVSEASHCKRPLAVVEDRWPIEQDS
jgi:hypothetical protein